MCQMRWNLGSLPVFVMVICLSLLLPKISSAGGLEDLFSRDIVDKIKSTELKDIFRPAEKSQDTSDSEPAQDNNVPDEAVEEKAVEKPDETAKPVEESAPPVVPASPEVAKEAEEVKAWCYSNARMRIESDCECVANKFIAERQTDPTGTRLNLVRRITAGNKCPNFDGIQADGYRTCMESIHMMNTGGHDPEAYCQCVGRRTAESVVAHKGKLGPSQRGNYRFYAVVYCRKAEAYQ